MQNQQKGDSLISYLAATAPALLQLVAVVSVGLIDTLKLDQLVLRPELINLSNFLVVILSISLISLSSFWDYNKFALLKPGEDMFSQVKNYWHILKMFCVAAFISTTVLIGIIVFKTRIINNIELWTFLQWGSYILSMIMISFIIYTLALLKIQERRNKDLYENYIPRLVDSLRRYGHVKNPEIEIQEVDRSSSTAVVKLGGASKYFVRTDYTGEMTSIEALKQPAPQGQTVNQNPQ